MDWISQAQALMALITGLAGLVSAAMTAYFSVKKVIKANKEKSLKEIWELIMKIADTSMQKVEDLYKSGQLAKKDKKNQALAIIEVTAKEAGIDIAPFTQQLSAYIDNTISFVNSFNKED